MLTDNYISKSGVQDKSRANTVKKIFSNGAVGFILVEIALAIAIVGFTLASITKMLVVASKSSEQQENVAVALNLAQARMEEIKNLDYKGDTIEKGEGSNYADSWLPDLVDVSINSYNPLIPEYLTESDYRTRELRGFCRLSSELGVSLRRTSPRSCAPNPGRGDRRR